MVSEEVKVAHTLYQSGKFANPFYQLDTGLTAHVAPGYPYLLASLLRWFGTGARGAFAIQNLETIALVLQIGLLPLLARQLGGSLQTGLIAAAIALIGLRRDWYWECSYVGLLLIVETILYANYLRTDSILTATLAGVTWGILLLFSPSALVVLIASILLAGLLHRRILGLLLFTALPLLVTTPWIWHQYHVFGHFIFIRDNFGIEMAASFNERAQYRSTKSAVDLNHPNQNRAEAERVIALGEPEYNALKLHEARMWVEANLHKAISLVCQRLFYFWLPPIDMRNPISSAVIWCSTLLSTFGLVALWRTHRTGALVISSFLLCFPLVYYIVQYIPRYRYPIAWVTFLLSGFAVEAFPRGATRRRPQELNAHNKA